MQLGAIPSDQSLLAGNAIWPVGSILGLCGAACPQGWLLCNGSLVDQSAYPALYAAIGHKWNRVGGTPTDPGGGKFRLPDLRRSLSIGAAVASAGVRGGSWDHQHASSLTHSHAHAAGTLADPGHYHGVSGLTVNSHAHTLGAPAVLALNAEGGPHDTGEASITCSGPGSTAAAGGQGLNGTMATAAPAVSGSTGASSVSAVAGSTGKANPPYQKVNYAVKA